MTDGIQIGKEIAMRFSFTITRDARCTLETMIEVDASDVEQARDKALAEAEGITDPARFSVRSIDLTAVEGSSEIMDAASNG